ncbi:hypothetical protein [Paenibacillus sp. Marseille-Q4541]|uniref:hypothetical protein n=1 Tax=Paenibacillus sp. Marseille-Q4541 TaxID=2831522 RepID=UPI001BA6EE1D|nr:hypothetical protein [Paenibacillus sp. Marseille-Q4541]
MRKSLQEFRDLMIAENKLGGHEDVLIAFDHLLDMVDEHEAQHQIELGIQRTNYEKSNGQVEAAIRDENRFFREAIHTVIKKTVLDLIHVGKKDWQKFYDRVQ